MVTKKIILASILSICSSISVAQADTHLSNDELITTFAFASENKDYVVAAQTALQLADQLHSASYAQKAYILYRGMRQYSKMLEAADLWASLQPQNTDAKNNLLYAQIQDLPMRKAVAVLSQAIQKSTDPQATAIDMANLLNSDDVRDAQAVLHVYVQALSPSLREQKPILQQIAKLADKAGDQALLKQTVESLVKASPDDELVYVGATTFSHLPPTFLIRHWLDYYQHNTAPLFANELLSYVANHIDDAKGFVSELLTLFPNNPMTYLIAMRSANLSHDTQGVYHLGHDALQLPQPDEDTRNQIYEQLVIAHIEDHQYKQAWSALNHITGELTPIQQYFKANLLYEFGFYPDAYRTIRQVQFDRSNWVNLQAWLEYQIVKAAKWSKKIPAFIRSYRTQPEVLNYVGEQILQSGAEDLSDAQTMFQLALKQRPHDAAIMHNLAYVYAMQDTHLNDAKWLIRQALKQSPQQIRYLDTYALVLLQLNQHQAALEVLQRIPHIWDDSEAAAHMIEAMYYTGQEQEAKAQYEALKQKYEEVQDLKTLFEGSNQ